MRALLAVLIAGSAVHAADVAPKGDLAEAPGDLDDQAGNERNIRVTLTIDGRKATVRLALPGGGTFQARGEMKIDEAATPKAWTGSSSQGLDGQDLPEIPAIYRLDGDTLVVCNGGPANDRPTEFAAGDGDLADIHRFRRAGGLDAESSQLGDPVGVSIPVREEGLEPSRLAAQEPKSCVSASSTTLAVLAAIRSCVDYPSRPDSASSFSPLFRSSTGEADADSNRPPGCDPSRRR